jgi:hypothetical protein
MSAERIERFQANLIFRISLSRPFHTASVGRLNRREKVCRENFRVEVLEGGVAEVEVSAHNLSGLHPYPKVKNTTLREKLKVGEEMG